MNLRVRMLSKPMIISYLSTALKFVFYNFWSAGMREILQRYYITVSILRRDPVIARGLLEKRKPISGTASFCITRY